jgi:hypothetical protein
VPGLDDEGGEQMADFVAGERDLAVGRGAADVFGGGGDGQERGGEHGQGGPAIPGLPAADLVLIQAGQALADLEVLWSHEGDVPGCNTVGAVSADGRKTVVLSLDSTSTTGAGRRIRPGGPRDVQ